MMKYRVSIFLLGVALFIAMWHVWSSWENYTHNAESDGQNIELIVFFHDWGRELSAGYAGEFVTLAIELAFLAGISPWFKPYDEDTEEIKALEKRMLKEFQELRKMNEQIMGDRTTIT